MATRSPYTDAQKGDSEKGQFQDSVSQATDQVQQTAGQVVEQAKQQATSTLSTQKDQAAGSVDSLAQALRHSGQQLRDKDQEPIAGVVDSVAERLEGFTGYLRRTTVEDMIADVEDFARQQPAVFLGGAFFLGLLASRFLRSSGQMAGAGGQTTALSRRYAGAYPSSTTSPSYRASSATWGGDLTPPSTGTTAGAGARGGASAGTGPFVPGPTGTTTTSTTGSTTGTTLGDRPGTAGSTTTGTAGSSAAGGTDATPEDLDARGPGAGSTGTGTGSSRPGSYDTSGTTRSTYGTQGSSGERKP